MYLVFGTYSDGSGYTHKTLETVSELIQFLVESKYDLYNVWQISQEFDYPVQVDLLYSNVPGESK